MPKALLGPLPRRALLATPLAAPAFAQADYPSRPVRFVVPGPAGGAGDVLGRLVMERLSARFGQPFTVENRPGAGTNIGMTVVARAAPDGYVLGLASIAANAVNRWLYRSLPFNPETDFAPIGMIALVPNLMVIPPSVPVRNVQEFIAWGRANRVAFGSVGAGSSQHLAGAQFGLATGLDMTHVAYTANGPMTTDLIENRVQALFQSISAVAELARAGRVRPIAVTGESRAPAFPDVPTMREQGVDIVSTGWFGVCAPAGTPEPILERLNGALNAILAEPEIEARIIQGGAVPRRTTRAEMAAFMAAESARWRPVIQATGATAD